MIDMWIPVARDTLSTRGGYKSRASMVSLGGKAVTMTGRGRRLRGESVGWE